MRHPGCWKAPQRRQLLSKTPGPQGCKPRAGLSMAFAGLFFVYFGGGAYRFHTLVLPIPGLPPPATRPPSLILPFCRTAGPFVCRLAGTERIYHVVDKYTWGPAAQIDPLPCLHQCARLAPLGPACTSANAAAPRFRRCYVRQTALVLIVCFYRVLPHLNMQFCTGGENH